MKTFAFRSRRAMSESSVIIWPATEGDFAHRPTAARSPRGRAQLYSGDPAGRHPSAKSCPKDLRRLSWFAGSASPNAQPIDFPAAVDHLGIVGLNSQSP